MPQTGNYAQILSGITQFMNPICPSMEIGTQKPESPLVEGKYATNLLSTRISRLELVCFYNKNRR